MVFRQTNHFEPWKKGFNLIFACRLLTWNKAIFCKIYTYDCWLFRVQLWCNGARFLERKIKDLESNCVSKSALLFSFSSQPHKIEKTKLGCRKCGVHKKPSHFLLIFPPQSMINSSIKIKFVACVFDASCSKSPTNRNQH